VTIDALVLTISNVITNGLMYDQKLLLALSDRENAMNSEIRIISARRALDNSTCYNAVYRFELLCVTYTPNLHSSMTSTTSTTDPTSDEVLVSSFGNLVLSLPDEIKNQLLVYNTNFAPCECETRHERLRSIRDRSPEFEMASLLANETNMIFIISQRNVLLTDGRRRRETQCVYYTRSELNGRLSINNTNGRTSLEESETARLLQVDILDAKHLSDKRGYLADRTCDMLENHSGYRSMLLQDYLNNNEGPPLGIDYASEFRPTTLCSNASNEKFDDLALFRLRTHYL
jgi:hypothetical protein